jgi:hypothetical protein
LVKLPDVVCQALERNVVAQDLFEDLYSIPEEVSKTESMKVQEDATGGVKKPDDQPKKWGPTLVDKRPSRRHQDGRFILEIAWERKKKKLIWK